MAPREDVRPINSRILVVVIMVVALIIGAITRSLPVPSWMRDLVPLAVAGAAWLAMRTVMYGRPKPVDVDPRSLGTIRRALDMAGATGVEPLVVKKPLPLLRMQGRQLLVPVDLLSLLSEDELTALIIMACASREATARAQMWRYWAPWILAFVVALVPSVVQNRPYYMIVVLAFAAWYFATRRKGLSSVQAARAALPLFLGRGGNAECLLSAVLKANTELLRRGYSQTAIVYQIRAMLAAITEAGGISPQRYQEIASAAQAHQLLT